MAKPKQKAVSNLIKNAKLVQLNTTDFQSLYLDTFKKLNELVDNTDLTHEYLFKTITILVLNRGNSEIEKLLSDVVFEKGGTLVENTLSSFICVLTRDNMLKELVDCGRFLHHTLCSAYENVMSHLDADMQKESGSIYTPKDIANYICYEVVNSYVKGNIGVDLDDNLSELDKGTIQEVVDLLITVTILEPSMGAGVIFIEMLDYIVEKVIECKTYLKELEGEPALTKAEKLDIHLAVLKNMYGMDINETALKLAKNCILLKLYTLGYNKAEIGLNVFCVNTALKGMPKGVSFDTGSNSGFKYDIVVGNPPYLRSKNISDVDKGLVQNYSVYHGNADLLCYFYELGFNLLKDGGVLGYITSNKWLTANYGEPLRGFIIDKCELIGILDFKDNRVFKGVGVDTEITFLRKKDNLSDRCMDFWYCDGTGYIETQSESKDKNKAVNKEVQFVGF